jgi:gluconate kinase
MSSSSSSWRPELVASQLDALEPLEPDEVGCVVESRPADPGATVAAAVAALAL